MCINIYISYVYICTYTSLSHAHIHTRTHTHTHTRVLSLLSLSLFYLISLSPPSSHTLSFLLSGSLLPSPPLSRLAPHQISLPACVLGGEQKNSPHFRSYFLILECSHPAEFLQKKPHLAEFLSCYARYHLLH